MSSKVRYVSSLSVNGRRYPVDPPIEVHPGGRVAVVVSADGETISVFPTRAFSEPGEGDQR